MTPSDYKEELDIYTYNKKSVHTLIDSLINKIKINITVSMT
jgi:hypothetical protein